MKIPLSSSISIYTLVYTHLCVYSCTNLFLWIPFWIVSTVPYFDHKLMPSSYTKLPPVSRLTVRPGRGINQTWLLSFPRSGNTWTRYLVEAATGVFTTSVYHDELLIRLGKFDVCVLVLLLWMPFSLLMLKMTVMQFDLWLLVFLVVMFCVYSCAMTFW